MLPTITITGPQLSDLFFNSELENYNRACKLTTIAREKEPDAWQKNRENALYADAVAFIDLIGNQVEPQDLVNDFLARL